MFRVANYRELATEGPLVCISGYVTLTAQQFEELRRAKCQEASDTRYAITGERSDCVCGQHENPVPLAPLFFDDAEDDDE